MNDLRGHLFEFVKEELSRIIATLNSAEFLLPTTCEFGRLEQRRNDGVYEVDTYFGGFDILLFANDVFALEEFFDDGCAGTWTTDTVLLHGIAQFFVFDGLARRFHSAQKGRLGIVFGRRSRFLLQLWLVRPRFAFAEGRKHLLFFRFVIGFLFGKDFAPTLFQHFASCHLKRYIARAREDGGVSHLARRIERCDETQSNHVIDLALQVSEVVGALPRRDNSMVIRDLAIIKDLLGFGQTASTFATVCLEGEQWCYLWEVVLNTAQGGRHLGIDVVAEESGIHTRIGSDMLFV